MGAVGNAALQHRMIWPTEPDTSNPIAAWCRKLLRACLASEIKPGVGYRVSRTAMGTTLEILPAGARVVYVKCCLADGSNAYLPVLVRGAAYTANAGTTTDLTVTAGNVPDGAVVLE